MKYLLGVQKLVRHSLQLLSKFIHKHKNILLILMGVFFLFLSIFYFSVIKSPHNFPIKSTVTIPNGSSLQVTADILHDEKVIRSSFWYKLFNIISGNQSNIQAGDYYFHTRLNLFAITSRISEGNYGLTPVVVRIQEGSTIFTIAEQLSSKFDRFNKDEFIERALKDEAEGYLFPDTYQFLPNVDNKKVYKVLKDTFNDKVATITPQIEEFGRPLKEIVIMASLIEKESSNDFEERQVISGILWNRINIGMALQVDAVFPYINGKNTYELSTEDLTIDSPYNTYKYPGLPIGPISNPSLESMLAAATPISTNYLFYLHDGEGQIHYSVTFEEHKQNKFKYLR